MTDRPDHDGVPSPASRRRSWHVAPLLLSGVLLAGPAASALFAQTALDGHGAESEAETRRATSAGDGTPSLRARPVPPSTELELDGRLEEGLWREAVPFSGFVQKEPVEGVPAGNDSDVWVFFDQEALYVGAFLHDREPEAIARNMTRRDDTRGAGFDYFEVLLDPNRDRRTGYRFRVSAAGVQADSYLYDDEQEDGAWDAVWESAVEVTAGGWSVELRIPLSQIRYETTDTARTWGVNFGRRRTADNEISQFALESRLQEGRVSQFGRLKGVVLSQSPRRLELLPYVVTTAHRGPSEPGDPFFDGREAEARAGLELSYGLGSAFTLDATVNPDFGQVEADPAVINLSAFETFLDERRPFFVEDARVFDFSLSGGRNSLFYSRRIGRRPHGRAPSGADFADVPESSTILGAVKLTGRTSGGLSAGALAAVTGREEGRAYFADEDSVAHFGVEPRTGYGVVRLQQDFRDGASALGGIVTGLRRDLPDDGRFDYLPWEAYSVGLDFEHTWSERAWALTGFLAASHVSGDSAAMIRIQRSSNHYLQRPDLEWSQLDSAATSLSGLDWRLQFERRSGRWTGAVWAAQVTSGFEINDLGFSSSPERLDGGMRVGYREVVPGDLLRGWSVNVFTYHNLSHELLERGMSWDALQWAHTSGSVSAHWNATFLNYWRLNGRLGFEPETMSRNATRGGPRMVDPGHVSWSVGLSTDSRKTVHVRPNVSQFRGRQGAGSRTSASLRTTIKPSSRLEIQVAPEFTHYVNGDQYVASTAAVPYEPTYGRRYLFADLKQRTLSMETRVDWTFTPTLSLQLFAQPLLSSGDYLVYKQLARSESFAFEPFEEGSYAEPLPGDGDARCIGGRTCVSEAGTRYMDFDGDGTGDYAFRDRDFNVRSLRATAVLRWEYRPGSNIYLVWQRRQNDDVRTGDFDVGRDLGALFDAPSDDRLILKADLWLPF